VTDADLDELEWYERAASPGPWTAITSCRDCDQIHLRTAKCVGEFTEADRDLIRMGREALPRLIAEVRRLRAREAQFRDNYGNHPAPADIYIQWKGTTVCGDFHCDCGHTAHVCGADFMYYVHCPKCDRRFEVPHTLPLMVSADRDSIAVTDAEDDGRIHESTSADRLRAAERLAEAVAAWHRREDIDDDCMSLADACKDEFEAWRKAR
jgi:hypothetical protein